MRFDGKVAIVTGSSDGIGLETARRLAAEGARVVWHGRDEARLRRAAGSPLEGSASTPGGVFVRGDLTRGSTVRRLVTTALREFGRLDILINNAGGSHHGKPLAEIDAADWDRTLSVNLRAAFRLIQAAVPALTASGGGRIVNVASLAGRERSPLAGADYVAAKAGVLGLTRQLAWDLGPVAITVNAVAPGVTLTDRVRRRWQSRSPEDREAILESIPLRRLAAVSEVVSVITFLASDEASYLTGATIDVNGGRYMA
jgi:NAD(P)-dependent dehydrogenase (short-subunit alcohol dehydrogenase family)